MESGELDEDEILSPKGRATHFTQDYFHRKYTIDFQIAITKTAEQEGMEVAFFDRYFDKVGSNRKGDSVSIAKITLGKNAYLIPDAVFLLEHEQEKYFYCAEIYNGKDTKRVVTQLEKHVRALETGSPSIKYGIDKGNRVLCLFEHLSIQQAVIKRLRGDEFFANVTEYFLFKHLDDLKTAPFDNWLNLDGDLVRMR